MYCTSENLQMILRYLQLTIIYNHLTRQGFFQLCSSAASCASTMYRRIRGGRCDTVQRAPGVRIRSASTRSLKCGPARAARIAIRESSRRESGALERSSNSPTSCSRVSSLSTDSALISSGAIKLTTNINP